MSPERWQQIDQLLDALLDCPPLHQTQLLEQACAGDLVLRQEVEALLAAQQKVSRFIETPPATVAALFSPQTFPQLNTAKTLVAGLVAGMRLKERYLIEGELGRGGVGVVYLARDTQLHQRRVVVKVLLAQSAAARPNPWFQKKFEQEIEALARIDHPGVVGVLDAGALPDGQPFFVMQFVAGVMLRTLMGGTQLALPRVIRLVRQIAQALSAAHDKGVVHRDLKPENIMVQANGEEESVKLIDFGIASLKDSHAAASAEKTQVAGTLPYMAPEQFRGQPEPASDIWALGVIAYELLTGRLPFQAETMVQLYELQQAGLGLRLQQLRPELPGGAQAALIKALAFKPDERFARARDFGEELARALTGAEQASTGEAPMMLLARTASTMPLEPEMAHILFMDLVGYSKLPADDQVQRQQTLHQFVQQTREFARAQQQNQLISLPTGDGMALVFFRDPVAPVQCAIELAQTLRAHPELPLRMGVHSGLVYRVADINANRNVAGGGINVAQRVMDCGEAGHILVSSTVAGVLGEDGHWAEYLTDWGEQEVKHGARVHLFNLHTGAAGRQELPEKLRHKLPPSDAIFPVRSFPRWARWGTVFCLLVTALLLWFYGREKWFFTSSLPTLPTAVIAETIPVAILPLDDAPLSKAASVISEGVIEEMIGLLSRYPHLRVTARSTVFRYKGQPLDPQKIGRELNVNYILTGRMTLDKGRYLVKTEFIKTADGSLVLDGNYSRTTAELPTLAADIIQHISAKLKAVLTTEEQDRLHKGYTQNPQAYQLFLAGRHLLQKRNPEDCFKSIALFQRAIALDPQFANAFASLAEAYFIGSGDVRDLPRPQADPAALAAARQAVALAPSLAEAHAIFGVVSLYWEFNWTQAEQEYKRALELNPSYPFAHLWYGDLLLMQKRFDEARRQYQQAVELDPLSPAINAGLGHYFYFSRQFEPAAQQYWKAIELDNNYQDAHYWLGNTYIQLKEYARAIEQYLPPIAIAEENDSGKLTRHSQEAALLRRAYETQGMEGYWRTKIGFWAGKQPNVDFPAVILGHLHAYLGEKENALAALKLASETRSSSLKSVSGLLFLKVDPRLDLLRDDPRFAELIRQTGLTP